MYCDRTAGHKQFRRSFKYVGDNFYIQMIEKSMRRGSVLDLVLTSRKKLVENVMLQGSCGCSDHEVLEFEIPHCSEKDIQVAHWSGLQESILWPIEKSRRWSPVG